MAKKKKDSDIATAQAIVDLEYGPQMSAVRDAYNKATQQYHRDLSGARQIARGIQGQAGRAIPEVQKTYDTATKGLAANNAFTDAAVAAVRPGQSSSPLSEVLQQAMARERGAAKNRIVDERAAAVSDLQKKGVEAEAGKAMAYTLAKSNLKGTRADLTQKLEDLTGLSRKALSVKVSELQKASDEAAAAGDKTIKSGVFSGLTEDELDAMSPTAIENWKKTHDASGLPKSSKGGGKKPRATSTQQLNLSDEVKSAMQFGAPFFKKTPRPKLGSTLIKGQKPTTANPDVDEIPRHSQFAVSLALDMGIDGHISRANAQRLHRLGYKVEDIEGAISATQYGSGGAHDYRKAPGRPD